MEVKEFADLYLSSRTVSWSPRYDTNHIAVILLRILFIKSIFRNATQKTIEKILIKKSLPNLMTTKSTSVVVFYAKNETTMNHRSSRWLCSIHV